MPQGGGFFIHRRGVLFLLDTVVGGNYKLSVGECTVVMGTVCGSMKEAGLSKSMDAYRYSPCIEPLVQWGSDNRGLYIHVHCKITPGFI